jgi:hypothetical protein
MNAIYLAGILFSVRITFTKCGVENGEKSSLVRLMGKFYA